MRENSEKCLQFYRTIKDPNPLEWRQFAQFFKYLFYFFFAWKHPPSRLEGEPGGVSSVAAQRAERPHDQLEAGVVDVPQVDVLMGDLHGALAVDVQVGGRHQVDVEAL